MHGASHFCTFDFGAQVCASRVFNQLASGCFAEHGRKSSHRWSVESASLHSRGQNDCRLRQSRDTSFRWRRDPSNRCPPYPASHLAPAQSRCVSHERCLCKTYSYFVIPAARDEEAGMAQAVLKMLRSHRFGTLVETFVPFLMVRRPVSALPCFHQCCCPIAVNYAALNFTLHVTD